MNNFLKKWLKISLIDAIAIVIAMLFTHFSLELTNQLIEYLDFDLIDNSYFVKMMNFDWIGFSKQFFVLEAIFLLIGIAPSLPVLLFWINFPKSFHNTFKRTATLYHAITLTISLSITMTEIVFVTTTSIIAFAVLIYPFLTVFFSKFIQE